MHYSAVTISHKTHACSICSQLTLNNKQILTIVFKCVSFSKNLLNLIKFLKTCDLRILVVPRTCSLKISLDIVTAQPSQAKARLGDTIIAKNNK